MAKTVLGIIGGSGVYDIAGLEHARWDRVVSPWGEPSDQLLFGRLAGVDMIFLPRHGRGHVHSPTTINYRANIDALKRAGATDVISISACGSFRENLAPGTFVIVDQFIDRTHAREKSFFGKGFVAHVSLAHPILPGKIFSPSNRFRNHIRINCGHTWSETHERALLRLGRLCESARS